MTDTPTTTAPRTAREEKRLRVWAHLERHCRGKARRMTTAEIMGAVELDKRELAAAISDLRRIDRRNIATDDAGDEVGVWLPEGPEGAAELDVAIFRMHRRIDGETETVNAMMASRFRDFPPEEFPVQAEMRHVGKALHRRGHYKRLSEERLPDGYERDVNAKRARGVNRHIGREAKRLAEGGAPAPSEEVYFYVCIGCGELVARSMPPDKSPTHTNGCRDALLLQPRDAAEARRWAAEIEHVERLQAERAALVGGHPCVAPVAVETGGRT
jgi:hypothetical protein